MQLKNSQNKVLVLVLFPPGSTCVPDSSLGTSVYLLWKPRAGHHHLLFCLPPLFQVCQSEP